MKTPLSLMLCALVLAGCTLFKAPAPATLAPLTPAAAAPADTFARFLSWLPGEYDNYEQFWLQTVELPEAERPSNPHEHTHHIIAPVAAPAVGAHVFFVKQTLPQDGNKVYRLRLYRFAPADKGAVKMEIFSFKDESEFADAERKPELLAAIKLNRLNVIEGCEVLWYFNGSDTFDGSVNGKTCRIDSERLKSRIFVEDRWKLTHEQLWIREAATNEQGQTVYGRGEPHKNRKARFFEGWGAIKKEGLSAPRESKNWVGTRGVVIHTEGQFYPLQFEDGKPSGYSMQLARLTYQGTQQAILKLAIVEDASGKSVAYSWAEIDATRIGINLGWIQAGLSLKKVRPEWSW